MIIKADAAADRRQPQNAGPVRPGQGLPNLLAGEGHLQISAVRQSKCSRQIDRIADVLGRGPFPRHRWRDFLDDSNQSDLRRTGCDRCRDRLDASTSDPSAGAPTGGAAGIGTVEGVGTGLKAGVSGFGRLLVQPIASAIKSAAIPQQSVIRRATGILPSMAAEIECAESDSVRESHLSSSNRRKRRIQEMAAAGSAPDARGGDWQTWRQRAKLGKSLALGE